MNNQSEAAPNQGHQGVRAVKAVQVRLAFLLEIEPHAITTRLGHGSSPCFQ